jgi:geranylgeranyl pyrophosphate synthase
MDEQTISRGRVIKELEKNKETVDSAIYGFLDSISSQVGLPSISETFYYGSLNDSYRERSYLINLIRRFYGLGFENVKELCIAAELLNASTFFIDDILDNASIRENKPTVWKKYGLRTTLNAHEVLRSICHQLINDYCERLNFDKHRLLRIIYSYNKIFYDAYIGQQLDIESENRSDFSEEEYFRLIELSPGSQFEYLCQIVAIAANAPLDEVKTFRKMGLNFAVCGQIRDDMVELLGDQEVIGKEVGLDLKDGRPRLPIIKYISDKNIRIGDISIEPESLKEIGKETLPYVKTVLGRLRSETLMCLSFAEGSSLYNSFSNLLDVTINI